MLEKSSQAMPPEKSPSSPAIAVEMFGVGASFGEFEILREVSAQVPKGRQTIIIGPNGGGKSTLIHCLLGQIPYEGRIVFDPPRPRIGYVPQRSDFDRYLPLTANEFLALGLTRRPIWLGLSGVIRRRVKAALDLVKAGALGGKPLGGLSGGETQKVLLASALLTDPDILVLDEPATGVDVYGEQLLCELLEGFKSCFTVIMVSHDLATARAHGDWVICLNRRVVEQGPPEKIFQPATLSATFGLHQGLIFGSHQTEPEVAPAPPSCCH
ncbi:MAG: metal ABC transporter ATP-binding protein [Deltaproteobacteria bacterium]|jgi:zinc transport system ATP-binding protein|nr:metal ABC transporter ATP-binding protein [Deltaproteobacteria bacterium]